MRTDHRDERIKALRQDPDFRALVNALESQTPEQVAALCDYYEDLECEQQKKGLRDVTHD